LRDVGTVDQALERGRALRLVSDPVVVGLLQAVDCALLRGIGLETALGKRVMLVLLDVHGGGYAVKT
jgi:hypothetical protein